MPVTSPGKDKVGLRFPWAYHPPQREGWNAIQEMGIFRADVLQVALRKHWVVRLAHQRCEVGDDVRLIHDSALRNRTKDVTGQRGPCFPIWSQRVIRFGRRFPGSKSSSIRSSGVVCLLHLGFRESSIVGHCRCGRKRDSTKRGCWSRFRSWAVRCNERLMDQVCHLIWIAFSFSFLKISTPTLNMGMISITWQSIKSDNNGITIGLNSPWFLNWYTFFVNNANHASIKCDSNELMFPTISQPGQTSNRCNGQATQ